MNLLFKIHPEYFDLFYYFDKRRTRKKKDSKIGDSKIFSNIDVHEIERVKIPKRTSITRKNKGKESKKKYKKVP